MQGIYDTLIKDLNLKAANDAVLDGNQSDGRSRRSAAGQRNFTFDKSSFATGHFIFSASKA